MRLLQWLPDGDIVLTGNLRDGTIPPYAILSHTWGDDNEEVTFDDMVRGTGKGKVGYEKIKLCGKQADGDGLQYFWVDSCCIDKSNKAELQNAISSMFRWYRHARKCYVYLSDVSDNDPQLTWEQAFQKSRWFTRGWTLQELLAPRSVEFFSKTARLLGDRQALEHQIHDITGIPRTALRGGSLSGFTTNERMKWIEIRNTKLEEDRAYSLLGIFGVDLSLRYGEGQVSAFARLEKEIEKLERCLQDLRLNDPHHHKKRIEHVKGGLLDDAYRWVLDNPDFQTWCTDEQSRLLWIKGDPGKGKTMLLCGIINELSKPKIDTTLLSYFFLESTDSRINTATAVLRSLTYMLICQQPMLVSHIRRRYDHAGKTLFEDPDAWFALADILIEILEDPILENTYLIIDALDECVAADLSKLTDFIVERSSSSPRVKWLVSSRNWPVIEAQMNKAESRVKLCLELNETSIATAVGTYIKHKVQQLVQDGNYNLKTRNALLDHLSTNAGNTFLWVALVCENVRGTPQGIIHTRLKSFPPGLDSLYGRMIAQVSGSRDSALCKRILAVIVTVFEPISLHELTSLVEMLEESSDDLNTIQQIINLCGCFLVVRENTIYFVHQSAKDYLLENAFEQIFPSGTEVIDHSIFSRSLEVLSQNLRRNIYSLNSLGSSVEQVQRLDPDPLAAIRYSCLHWVDHLHEASSHGYAAAQSSLQKDGVVCAFIREKFLYWLEAVSLCGRMPVAVLAMMKLEKLMLEGDATVPSKLMRDACRFVLYHKQAIELNPLQAYVSALLFSPTGSLIRKHFEKEMPRWATIKPDPEAQWSTCLQTLEGHTHDVDTVAFSNDSTLIASGSADRTVRIWKADSGACLGTLTGHRGAIRSVAFSYDSSRIASASRDCTIKIWDTSNGRCLHTLKAHHSTVDSVAFAPTLMQLASASTDWTVKIWRVSDGTCLRTLRGHKRSVKTVVFSSKSTLIASGSVDDTIKIWNADSGECLRTLECLGKHTISLSFSHDLKWVASVSLRKVVKIWNSENGHCVQTVDSQHGHIYSVAFSHDSLWLALAFKDGMIEIRDTSSGMCLHTLEGHGGTAHSVAFSRDSTWLISGSQDATVRVWDISNTNAEERLDIDRGNIIKGVFLRHNAIRPVTLSSDHTVKICDAKSGACLQTVCSIPGAEILALSPDSTWLVSRDCGYRIKVWDVSSGTLLQLPDSHHNALIDILTFSQDSTLLVAASSYKCTIRIWDVGRKPELILKIDGIEQSALSVMLPDSEEHVSLSYECVLKVWDAITGVCLRVLDLGHVDFEHLFYRFRNSKLSEPLSGRGEMSIWDATRGEHVATAVTAEISFTPSSDIVVLSLDREWITYNSKKLIWLPPEYRTRASVELSEGMVAVCSNAGKAWWCIIDVDELP